LTHEAPVTIKSALWKGQFAGFLARGILQKMARPAIPKPPSDPELGDIPDRLKELSSRLAAEKSQHAAQENPPKQYQGASDYSKGYRLISEFVAGVLVGAAVGFGLDKLFGTLPLFLIIFVLVGFAAGILNMSRAANRTAPSAEELARMPKPNDDEDEDK
jgi:ATP synthase protein I